MKIIYDQQNPLEMKFLDDDENEIKDLGAVSLDIHIDAEGSDTAIITCIPPSFNHLKVSPKLVFDFSDYDDVNMERLIKMLDVDYREQLLSAIDAERDIRDL